MIEVRFDTEYYNNYNKSATDATDWITLVHQIYIIDWQEGEVVINVCVHLAVNKDRFDL